MIVFFFNDTATTEIYTLSLHDALPISVLVPGCLIDLPVRGVVALPPERVSDRDGVVRLTRDTAETVVQIVFARSEEHTSELQSRQYLVCRLLLEKKKIKSTHKPELRDI